MDIEIRSAKIDELPTLLEFEQGIITAERPYDPYLKDGDLNYYDLKGFIESEDVEVAVAVIDSKIVGSGYVRIKDSLPKKKHDKHAFMGFMYVDPDYRGLGINKKIIDYLKKWARERGMDHAVLNVYPQNTNAIKAYEKVGFKQSLLEMNMDF